MTPFVHIPVMLGEVVRTFETVPPGLVVDATLGGGSHTEALLQSRPDISVLGIDRDRVALEAASARLAPFGSRVHMMHGRFSDVAALVHGEGVSRVTGILADLGVSSPQLDVQSRGFAHRHTAPLDMRMDTSSGGVTAGDIVNSWSETDIARILREFGDERFAARIAKVIVARRPIDTTTALAELVRDAIPAATRRTGGHPAARTFQALRIEVNGELRELQSLLDATPDLLVEGGRALVLTYHSGEDRMVKHHFATCAASPIVPRGMPVEPDLAPFSIPPMSGDTATETERDVNPRSRSVRIRILERRVTT